MLLMSPVFVDLREIKAAQAESWRDLLTSATNEEEGKLWRVTKSLKGSPDSNSPIEAMIHKGKTVVSNKRKADIFARHYAAVSRHKFTKEERATNRELKKPKRPHSSVVK